MPDKEIPRQFRSGSPTTQAHAAHPVSAVKAATGAGRTGLPPHTRTPLRCRQCGVVDVPRVTPGTGMHAYRADCARCGAFVQFLSQHSPEERARRRQQAAMQRQPATEAQLHYLAILGDRGPQPSTKWEASQRIAQLLSQRKGA
jgi:hypothetical protein